MTKKSANYINHIALVLDASWSMLSKAQELVKVADNQIAYLAQRSQELNQETRITVYSFSGKNRIECLIYDKDVLRMPSIADLYANHDTTALIDATVLSIEDLEMTPEKYGEHAFLIYVLTDGIENDSVLKAHDLAARIEALPDHWTLAAFVPDQRAVFEAKKFGFPKENIAVWDTEGNEGLKEVGAKIRETTDTWMQNRTRGIRGTRSLFTMAKPTLETIEDSLTALHFGQYRLLDVDETGRIDEFVESMLQRPYKLGEAYYQLTKTEMIQPQKQIAIFNKHKVYIGDDARKILGLPDTHIKVSPSSHPYEIFVQSTSVSRKLMAGTKLLILS